MPFLAGLQVLQKLSAGKVDDMVAKEGAVSAVVTAIKAHVDTQDLGWELLLSLGECKWTHGLL